MTKAEKHSVIVAALTGYVKDHHGDLSGEELAVLSEAAQEATLYGEGMTNGDEDAEVVDSRLIDLTDPNSTAPHVGGVEGTSGRIVDPRDAVAARKLAGELGVDHDPQAYVTGDEEDADDPDAVDADGDGVDDNTGKPVKKRKARRKSK